VLGNVGLVGDLAGTLTYMAPEVFRGLPIDGRTDLYSLGVLAYLLLSGRAPYDVRGASDPELAFAALPPSLTSLGVEIPAALDDLLLALLSTDLLARPASAAELIDRCRAVPLLPPRRRGDARGAAPLSRRSSRRGFASRCAWPSRRPTTCGSEDETRADAPDRTVLDPKS